MNQQNSGTQVLHGFTIFKWGYIAKASYWLLGFNRQKIIKNDALTWFQHLEMGMYSPRTIWGPKVNRSNTQPKLNMMKGFLIWDYQV